MPVLVAELAKYVSWDVAKTLVERWKEDYGKGKLQKVETMLAKGSPLIPSIVDGFGKAAGRVIEDILGQLQSDIKFAQPGQYEEVTDPSIPRAEQLRRELNINVAKAIVHVDVTNRVQGVVAIWSNRFQEAFTPLEPKETETLDLMRKVLRGDKRRLSEVVIAMFRLGAGVGAVAALIGIVAPALGIGVGILVQMKIFVLGHPMGALAGGAALTIVLATLATVKLSDKDTVNVAVSLGEELCVRRSKPTDSDDENNVSLV